MRSLRLALAAVLFLGACADATAPVTPAPSITCTTYLGAGGVPYDVCVAR